MCMGCSAAYAAVAASTALFSLSELNGKESAFTFTVSSADLAQAAAITTSASGSSAITIRSTAPATNSAAVNRGIDRTSQQAI